MDAESSTLQLSSPVQYLPGVGASRAERLLKLGVRTAQDVLFLFPRDYEFPAPTTNLDALSEGVSASLVGEIIDAELVTRNPGKSIFSALVENESGVIRILFFNQSFRAEQLTLGCQVMVSGTPKLNGLRMEMVHPKVTVLDLHDQVPQPLILPIYPLTDGIKQADLRRLSGQLVAELAGELTEVMPASFRELCAKKLRKRGLWKADHPLVDIEVALRQLHWPESEPQLKLAHTRLVFQELLVMQLALAMRRRKLTTELRAPPLPSSALIDARIIQRFPFELTADQKQVVAELRQDMARQFPMNRMLQGDVGSGKTIVAVYAMMLAVANQYQAVMMAPTEVLARQHYATLSRMLSSSRVRVGLLCGSLTTSERRELVEAVAAGEIDLIVGTQALIYGQLEFNRLGLCVIDEQHKFGVAQRVALRSGGVDPHYLVMSATPIPRSVAMTLFGDVDLSTLRNSPPGRVKVNTYLARDGWKERWWEFVRQRLNEGRQAYVVAPRVENKDSSPEDGEDVSSVEAVVVELRQTQLKDYQVGLLHGRMPNEEKQAIMQAFSDGELDVLVSTTVIEVGIDVPNATIMTILGAQRFGLAQLHQLRGRVCRGAHGGHVCVFTDGDQPPEENERLKTFEQTQDGFELAEADFVMRGPGDLLGRQQSGLPPMRIADLSRDLELLQVARQLAQQMIDEDPELTDPELAELKGQVIRRYGKRLSLGDVA
ncbi:MAG: ATP-dependent DNA helicase RecG [Planctomycetaceae bacterium]|nr:ATP-dependent DNA helicase RecG [Planctomycetaceae bacterium]